jgi:hypothetical protein
MGIGPQKRTNGLDHVVKYTVRLQSCSGHCVSDEPASGYLSRTLASQTLPGHETWVEGEESQV